MSQPLDSADSNSYTSLSTDAAETAFLLTPVEAEDSKDSATEYGLQEGPNRKDYW